MPKASPLSSIASSFQGGLIESLERGTRALLVEEVAEIFRVTPGTVYRLARKHAIPSFRFGGSLRVFCDLALRHLRCIPLRLAYFYGEHKAKMVIYPALIKAANA
jgi:excisionase family DNA binding protein